jgi:hypothetical protein
MLIAKRWYVVIAGRDVDEMGCQRRTKKKAMIAKPVKRE